MESKQPNYHLKFGATVFWGNSVLDEASPLGQAILGGMLRLLNAIEVIGRVGSHHIMVLTDFCSHSQ